ncbi:uncharacterized protein EDB91DRAFT_1091172 [Suillus paluster]|uniref:uncharacterized protein n=1 Tax=Suillus paluster TaxID=48578 RepID=UPI001B87EAE7|nr:uncharacterized protein EDB91DRAFT_1091172 [Suillus paluster]KAG1717258.1 hypothetical protein EDB91DRAFT_1091172 [Suillus paluster]
MSNTPVVTLVVAPTVIDTNDILIPGPNNPCWACNNAELPCTTRFNKRTGNGLLSCVFCNTKKGKSTTQKARSWTPSKAGATSTSAAGTASASAVTMPKTHGCSKTITAVKAPTPPPTPSPAPAPIVSSSARVPRAALNVPMPGLHSMAITICDSAGHIKALKERSMRAFDAKPWNTIPHSPFPLLRKLQHLCCLINLSLEQCYPLNPHSLLSLVFRWQGWSPHPRKLRIPLPSGGLIFEPSQVQLAPDPSPTPPTARDIDIVVLDHPRNLFPEYDSADDMDVEVKVEVEGGDEGHLGEVEMST